MPEEYHNKLLGGIILTGGGSNMPNIKRAFTEQTKIQKVRIAGSVIQNVTSSDNEVNAHNGTMNTAIGLLAKGDMNCAGSPIKNKGDLFGEESATTSTTPDTHKPPRKPGEIGPGVVMTEAEKLKIEEERLRKQREVEEERLRIEAERRLQEEQRQKKGSIWKKSLKSITDFGKKLISEEEDER